MRFTGDIATLLLCITLAPAPAPLAFAHHSPNQVIQSLTQRITKGERTPTIFVRRGDEYRAIGENQSAITDYDAALQLAAKSLPALYGMAQARFSLAQWTEALTVAKRGLALTSDIEEAAPFHAISARIHVRNAEDELALDSWHQAIASSRPNVNWFLGESRALKRLGEIDDARYALEAAMKRNPSTVLRRAWIESLIHCEELPEAEKYISAGLARARWKSSWLLLRARLRLAQNQSNAAHQDARTALSEISRRQSHGAVNPFLAADRGHALHILGRDEEAKDDLELARTYGVLLGELTKKGTPR